MVSCQVYPEISKVLLKIFSIGNYSIFIVYSQEYLRLFQFLYLFQTLYVDRCS